MDRWTQGEEVTLVGKLPDNAIDVTVSVSKVDGTPVVVDQPCQQIIISIFVYRFYPSDVGDYIWQMKGTHPQTGKLHTVEDSFTYGGWVDSLLKPEHLDMLAKEETVLTRTAPEDLEPLALEASLIPLAKEISLSLLAKEDTVLTRTSPDDLELLAKESSLLPLAQETSLVLLAKEATLLMRPTLAEIKQFTVTRILTAPRALELIAKSVSQYHLGQTATLVVMSTYAGAPTDVSMWVTVYYPNNTVWINEVQMTPLEVTGLYTHSFLIPADAPLGVYKVKYKAIKSIAAQEIPDTFTEPDGLPTNWRIYLGTWEVQSNVLKQTASGYSYLHWKDPLAVYWADYTFEADVKADTNINNFLFGLIVRYKTRTTLNYTFYYSKYQGRLCLLRGSSTIYDKVLSLNWNTWYRFKVEVSGASIKCYLDNELQFEYIDADPISSGIPTFYCSNPHSFDNVLITIPAQEYQEFEISDFQVTEVPASMSLAEEIQSQIAGVQGDVDRIPAAPAQEPSILAVKAKTDNLPEIPAQSGEYSAILEAIGSVVGFIKKVEWGRWKIANNQMVFYEDDGVTPLRTFDLKDNKGDPTEFNVFERTPV